MTFHHFVLTRFSYRQHPKDHSLQQADVFLRNDPLNPAYLDFRFALFECVCLPNIIAQSNQDFDWVLIIDPDLPTKYRQRLEFLVAKRKRTHLYEFRRDDLASLEWLEKFIPNDTDLVLTTNLDDDDIITVDFVEKIHLHIKELGTAVPSMKLFGLKSTYQWDLYSSTKYPFGTWVPWHRANFFRSTGLSMLCKTSAHRLTVYSLGHTLGDIWYVQGTKQQIKQVARETWGLSPSESCPGIGFKRLSNFQRLLEKSSASGGDDWKFLPPTELYYDLSEDGLIAVHLNHFTNDQATRLFEYKPGTVPVVDAQFFPDDIRIDWGVFNEHRNLFELSSQRYKKFLSEIHSYPKRLRLAWWQRFLFIVTMRTRLKWFYLRH